MFRPMRPVVVRRPTGAPLLRGAIVGGAAYGMGRRAAHNPQQGQPQPYYAAPTPAAAGGTDVASGLARLGAMVQQGLLTPEEFTAAKAKLLAP